MNSYQNVIDRYVKNMKEELKEELELLLSEGILGVEEFGAKELGIAAFIKLLALSKTWVLVLVQK